MRFSIFHMTIKTMTCKNLSMKRFKTFEGYLSNVLETRQVKNPAYTISAFARQLGLPPSRLSEILKGKIGISVKRAMDIADILKLSEKDKEFFINLVQAEHDRNPLQRQKAQDKISDFYNKYIPIEAGKISNWYQLALLELISLDENLAMDELASRLGLSEEITDTSIQELLAMGAINKSETLKGFTIVDTNRETAMDIPSESVKQLNEQILSKAAKELRLQDVSNRDFSIAVFGFNKEQLPMAKERIKQFRRDFMKEFESAPHKDSVYSMSVQFFELTQPHKNTDN